MALKPNTEPIRPSDGLEVEKYSDFPLVRKNFVLMIVSAIVTVAGFLLMLGSGSGADEFNPDIFSTRRIVIGPTVAFIGFIMMGISIILPTKKSHRSNHNTEEQ